MVRLLKWIASMPRSVKRIIIMLVDAVLLIAILWLSFSIRLDEWYWPPGGFESKITWLILLVPVIAIPIFTYFGLYRAIIRYLGMHVAWYIVRAVTLYAILWSFLVLLSGVQGIPRSVVLINSMVALLGVGGFRMLAAWVLRKIEDAGYKRQDVAKTCARVLIFGAGEAGRQLAVGLAQSWEYKLFGFVDDQRELQGRELMGVPILSADELATFVDCYQITDLLLAIPSISRKQRNRILEKLRLLPVRIRTLPGLADLVRGRANLTDLNELDIDDLLAREVAKPDEALLKSQVSNQIVLVTGAGGSIGSEICCQVLKRCPKVLLLLEQSEHALYSIHQELQAINERLKKDEQLFFVSQVIPLLGSVQDEKRLGELMQTWKPKVVYHTAAYKHVPMVEHNLAEGIKNNVFGTLTVAKVAIQHEVTQFVLISTDKAVRPTSGMGASKRIAEMVLQALVAESAPVFETLGQPHLQIERKTHLSMVRFGNVLGSSGSVVPLFQKQIRDGGPITLTHEDITRYFMTIPEAAQLVMQAGAMSGSPTFLAPGNSNPDNSRGKESLAPAAEVFALDMGEPVKIIDLARRMVELSGLRVKDEDTPEGDIAIEVIGLRPGEKLYEELLIGDNPQPTQHPGILKANEEFIPWNELQTHLFTLQAAAQNNDVKMISKLLQQLVKGYQPQPAALAS